MTDAPIAGIGHNSPPDPIDLAIEPFADLLAEVENWTDGEPVADDASMAAVDALIREIKSARAALKKARDESTTPLHQSWKAEVARWKPTEDDMQMRQDCLVAIVAPYKARKAAEAEEARRATAMAARKAEEEARQAARKAAAGDLAAQAEAAAKAAAHDSAQKAAQQASKSKVAGMRTIHHYEIEDMSSLLRWMNADRDGRAALEACADEFARRHHRSREMAGVRTWTTKEAF